MKYPLVVLSLASVLACTGAPGHPPGPSEEGGAGGQGGGGGTSTLDAAAGRDGSVADAASSSPDGNADLGTPLDLAPPDVPVPADATVDPPLAACPKPSVDHLEIWTAHGGSLRPAVGGNLLVKEGDRHQAKVDFLPGAAWHEMVVPLVNSLGKKTDLTSSRGFTLTYSATADLWVQLRPLSHPHGGEQHTAKLPSTGGMLQQLFIPFTPDAWGMLLGPPPFPFAQALQDANFFNFVGPPATANSIVVKGLRIDGFVPPCSP